MIMGEVGEREVAPSVDTCTTDGCMFGTPPRHFYTKSLLMPDVFTKRKRSEVMSRIRGRGNRDTELALARLLRAHGITGWRRNQPLLGKPDFLFPKARMAVFVDGCFWHGCPKHSKPARWLRKSSMKSLPPSAKAKRTGRTFWKQKLAANIARDRVVNRELRKLGWRVIRIWEHELSKSPERCVRQIHHALNVTG
jgi:DNA mismatch endonuclease (patch repair protein)